MEAVRAFKQHEITDLYQRHVLHGFLHANHVKVQQALQRLKPSRAPLRRPLLHSLPLILNVDEVVCDIIFGRLNLEKEGSRLAGALVLTNKRLLIAHEDEFEVRWQEMPYSDIETVRNDFSAKHGSVTIHAYKQTVHLRTYHHANMQRIITHLEHIGSLVSDHWATSGNAMFCHNGRLATTGVL